MEQDEQNGALDENQVADDYEWLRQQLGQEGAALALEQLAGAMAEGADDEWEDPCGGKLMPLLTAAADGDLPTVETLLEEGGVDINLPGPDGDTALHLASLYGHLEVVKFLLSKGAQAGAVNGEDGSTPHHDAAAGGYLEILQLLVEAAPEAIAAADEDGDTPLHNAARGNHGAVVEYLLQKGGDPLARNREGRTPAAESDQADVVRVLVSAAAAALQQKKE